MLFFFIYNLQKQKKIMKRKLEEESFCCKKTTFYNKNLITNNQKVVIEIDDDNEDDLEILYSRYPSTEYKISSIDKIIKNEEKEEDATDKSVARPNTYKATTVMRDSQQQAKFRADLVGHYEKCVISGKPNPILIDAAHIMPFKQVDSSLKTGFLLRKEIHWLWDRYEISINPQNWIVYLNKKLQNDEDYSKYHMLKLSNETIKLLKIADFELLKQHYQKFTDKTN
jgi:hypothetical protein